MKHLILFSTGPAEDDLGQDPSEERGEVITLAKSVVGRTIDMPEVYVVGGERCQCVAETFSEVNKRKGFKKIEIDSIFKKASAEKPAVDENISHLSANSIVLISDAVTAFNFARELSSGAGVLDFLQGRRCMQVLDFEYQENMRWSDIQKNSNTCFAALTARPNC